MREKNYNIEILRVIAFVMVIVIHVSNYFCRAYGSISSGEYAYSLIINSLARVSVPCFFMMSGALLLGRCETMQKSLKRALRFLFVLLVWTAIYYLYNTFYTKQGCDLRMLLDKPAEAHLWYLYVMIPVYFVLPFLQVLCQGLGEKLERAFVILGGIWLFIVHVMPYFKLDLYYDLPILGDRSYIYYLFLGYFLSKYVDKIKLKNAHLLFIYFGSSLLNAVLTALVTVTTKDHFERVLEYGNPIIIVSAVSFFALIMRLGNGKVSFSEKSKTWIDLCSVCSFGIYLIHIMFLDWYKIHFKADAYSAYAVIPLLVVLITFLSFASVYVIRKLPFGKKIT